MFQAAVIAGDRRSVRARWGDRALAADPRRMAALGAAILLAVQLAANYWTYTYLAWVFPLIALALLTESAARLRRLGLRHLRRSTRRCAREARLALLHERGAGLAEVVGRDQDLLVGDLLLE